MGKKFNCWLGYEGCKAVSLEIEVKLHGKNGKIKLENVCSGVSGVEEQRKVCRGCKDYAGRRLVEMNLNPRDYGFENCNFSANR